MQISPIRMYPKDYTPDNSGYCSWKAQRLAKQLGTESRLTVDLWTNVVSVLSFDVKWTAFV